MKKIFLFLFISFQLSFAQRVLSVDSVYNLSDSLKKIISIENETEIIFSEKNYLGFDINVSENGFGIGGQYKIEKYQGLTAYLSFSVSEVKDDKEVEYIDYWGQSYVPGKINRFLIIPLYANIEYKLFEKLISKNLRPFLTFGLGPVNVYSSPYDLEIFSSLEKGHSNYTLGYIFGIGTNFGSTETGFTGINLRYSIVNLNKEIPSLETWDKKIINKSKFGGFVMTLTFAKTLN